MNAALSAPALAAHYAHCEAHLKAADRDAWLAALFAPADKRPYLHALGAFLVEIRNVRHRVAEALAGELRLQWWRDAIEGEARGDVASHPVAAALLDTIGRCRLPRETLTDLIEAHRFDLYDDPMETLHHWESYCEATAAAPIRLAAIVLTGKGEPGGIAAAAHAGVALSAQGQLADLADARRPVFVPVDVLARHNLSGTDMEAGILTPPVAAALADMRGIGRLHLQELRRHWDTVEPAAQPAFLTVRLVEPSFRLAERPGADPFREALVLSPWRRQWLIWRASRGRVA